MKAKRRWFLAAAILLLVPLVFAAYSRADRDREETKFRWDVVQADRSTTPPTLRPGGTASVLANDGSKINLTGSGIFVVPEEPAGDVGRGGGQSNAVTGGGNWETFTKTGISTGHGTYDVISLEGFELPPGTFGPNLLDGIGNPLDARPGLVVLRIRYSDGDRGFLIVSCHLLGTPDSNFEGVTATKASVDYWNVLRHGTLFHIIHEGED